MDPFSLITLIAIGVLGTALIVSIIVAFVRRFQSNARDRAAREVVNRAGGDCAILNAFTITRAGNLINDMLRGFTANRDERAILAILECADCNRLREIIREIGDGSLDRGTRRLKRNLQGDEDKRLDVLLANCGI